MFKNITNNWLTEKLQKLKFFIPGENETVIAEWNHIVQIYNSERELYIKETKLDFATIFPAKFDKQKVQLLTVNVFNEKTSAVLRKRGNIGTAVFVENMTNLFNMLNVKSPEAARQLNDPDRAVFSTYDDERYDYLLQMAESFERMDTTSTKYTHRVMSLTADTSNALVITLRGLESLVKYLLSKDIKYIMLGDMQSDRIEGEFGAYRRLNGGNYYMSADHVQNALKLHRIELFSSLEVDDIVWH